MAGDVEAEIVDATIVARGPQIILVQRDNWDAFYQAEIIELTRVAGESLLAFEHVGSTAVRGLAGKPVIDILAGAATLLDADAIAGRLQRLGYIRIPFRPATPTAGEPGGDERLFFLKRPVDNSEGVELSRPGYNIHVVNIDRFLQDDQLLLRDYLRAHPELAAEYGRLKCELVGRIRNYSEYTPAKSAFIERALAAARGDARDGRK